MIDKRLIAVVFIVTSAACEESPAPDEGDPLTVMTWNLYLGTDFQSLFDVTSAAELPAAAAAAWANVQASDFPARAVAIADVIAAERPGLIGLQEVELYRLQSPGDGLGGTAAEDVALDFLSILLAELSDRGLDYTVAGETANVDIEVPMIGATGIDDIRITDRDVVLRSLDVAVDNVQSENFVNTSSVTVTGVPTALPIPRGWVALDAAFQGQSVRFCNTHLEVFDAAVREQQAQELVTALANATLPVVMVGDFNATADEAAVATIVAAGYRDAWDDQADPGFTCCQAEDLRNETSLLSERIDYVYVAEGVDVVETLRVGAEPGSRTDSGLWPSDHAGVVTRLHAP